MALSDFARSFEMSMNNFNLKKARAAGWPTRVSAYYGFGDTTKLRVLARVMMHRPGEAKEKAERGFRQFFTIQVSNHPVTIHAGQRTVETVTNEGGYVDIPVTDHGLEPGWQTVTVTAKDAEPVEAEVLIVEPGADVGLVSDIDDTIMVTMLPRAMIAAYNSWYLRTNARKAVPGMNKFYAHLRAAHPNMPVFYLSTGAWNTFDALKQFITDHQLPKGPMLLTDWGPTQTGMFRSGKEHKRVQLRNLFIDFPNMKWILVGDDGQHDPFIYGDAASEHPERVNSIGIRELTPGEHVLAHGTATPLTTNTERGTVPLVRGADGHELLAKWQLSRPSTDGQRSTSSQATSPADTD